MIIRTIFSEKEGGKGKLFRMKGVNELPSSDETNWGRKGGGANKSEYFTRKGYERKKILY